MSYMQDLEARLKPLLAGMPEERQAIAIREIKAITLESYRNGQEAGAPAKRSRSAGKTAKAVAED